MELVSFSPIENVPDVSLIPGYELNSPPETPEVSQDVFSVWEADSLTLLADAHNVRRLLKLSLRSLQLYMIKGDQILDALFIAEKEIEMKLQLSVTVSWLVFCERQHRLRAASKVVTESVKRGILKQHFGSMVRVWRISVKLVWRSQRSEEKRRVDTLREWNEVIVSLSRPGRQLEMNMAKKRKFLGLSSWRKLRTQRHFENIHALSQLDAFRISQAISIFKIFVEQQRKSRIARKHFDRFVIQTVCEEWTLEVTKSRHLHKQIFSIKCAPYLLYKLGVNVTSVAWLHVPKYLASEPSVMLSVGTVAFRKWRNFTREEILDRKSCQQKYLLDAFNSWKLLVKQSGDLTRSVTRMKLWQLRVGKSNTLHRLLFVWKERAERRSVLREGLEKYSDKTAFWRMVRVVSGWRMLAESEKKLDNLRKEWRRKRLARNFLAIKSLKEKINHENTLNLLSSLFAQRAYARLLLGVFRLARALKLENQAIEDKGSWLCLRVRFDRWCFALEEKKRLQSILHEIRMKSIKNSLAIWELRARVERFRAVGEAKSQIRMKRTVLFLLELHWSQSRKKRMDAVLVNELAKKNMFNRFVRFGKQRREILQKHESRLQKLAWKNWVCYMGISDVMQSIEKIRTFFVKSSMIQKLRQHASNSKKIEQDKFDQIVHSRAVNVLQEWRLLALFLSFKQHSHSAVLSATPSEKDKKELVGRYFSIWIEEFGSFQRVCAFVKIHEKNLIRSILKSRASPWRLAVLESRLARKVNEGSAAACLGVWMFGFEQKQRIASDLANKFETVIHSRRKLIFHDWKFFVANRKRSKWAIYVEWRAFTRSVRHQLAGLVWFIPEIESRRRKRVLSIWRNRFDQRMGLKMRVSHFSENSERRLLVAGLFGFVVESERKRKIRFIAESREKQIFGKFIDKWVHATVLAMSLKQIFERMLVMMDKIRCVYYFRNLQNHCRIENFLQNKRKLLDSLNLGQKKEIISQVFFAWKSRLELRKISLVLCKKNFLKNLKAFSVSQQNRKSLIAVADEWCIVNESSRMAVRIEEILIQWRDFTAYSIEEKIKFSALQSLNLEACMTTAFGRWKYALEVVMYESDLQVNQEELLSRISQKIISNIFTYLVILFREAQGLAKFSSDYASSSLVKRVMVAWTGHVEVMNKKKFIESESKKNCLRRAFKSVFKEVYLLFKERLHRKQFVGKEIFNQLRFVHSNRKKKLIAKSISKWKSAKESTILTQQIHLKSVVLTSWRVITNETKLLKAYLPPSIETAFQQTQEEEYTPSLPQHHDSYLKKRIRSKATPLTSASITPVVQPAPAAVGSYKQLRSLISQQI